MNEFLFLCGFQPMPNRFLRCSACSWKSLYTDNTTAISIVITHAREFPNCQKIAESVPTPEVRKVCLEIKCCLPSFARQFQSFWEGTDNQIKVVILSALGFYMDDSAIVICRMCQKTHPYSAIGCPITLGIKHASCIPSVHNDKNSRFAHIVLVQELMYDLFDQPKIQRWCTRTFSAENFMVLWCTQPVVPSMFDVLNHRSETEQAFDAHAEGHTIEGCLQEVDEHPLARFN